MEENTKRIIEIEVDLGKASGRLAEVTREMDDLKKSSNALKKENAELMEQVRKGEKAWSDVSKQVEENSKTLADNEARTKALKAEQSTLHGQITETTKRNRQYGDSYKELSARLADMKNAYRSFTKEQRESAEGQELLKQIQETDAAMKEADASLGNFQRNVGNYPNAVKPVTAVLREMQQELIRLRLEGKANTEEYNELLMKTGQMKDAMNDARREVKQMASDTSALNSVLDGAKLAAGGFSAALGIMNLVGDEDSKTAKELADAQKKLQSAIAITTGLQAVQNALQKESALMMGINKVQIWAAAKAQDAYTAATGRATVAQRIFNAVAKSNPYVLLAAAILSVVGAIAAFTSGSKEQESQLKSVNIELNNHLEIVKLLNENYNTLTSRIEDNMQSWIERAKELGASTEKIRAAEDALHEERLKRLKQQREQLGYGLVEVMSYEVRIKELSATISYTENLRLDALRKGNKEMADTLLSDINYWNAQLKQLKERVNTYNELNRAINQETNNQIKLEKEREKQDAEAAKAQEERDKKAREDAAKAAEDRRKKREEDEKKYSELTIAEAQKAEDALNALIADQYEQRRAIEETDYNRKVAALQKSMEAEAKAHGTQTLLYKAYLSQQETLRLQHQQKMSDIAQDQLNDERELQKKAVQQLEADNSLYWQNRINEAIIKGQQTGQLELDMLKERFETMQQLADESDEAFYARRLEAEKAYIQKKKSLADAEKAIEKAKQEYIADIAGSISDIMEKVAGDNKAMVRVSKVVALAEVAIKQGVAIAEAVAASAAGDPYTYALRVAAAIASTVSAMATAIESINSAKLARGTSYVQGPGTETSDSIPAMLSKGEGVVNAKANRMFPGVVGAMNDASVGIWSPMMSMLRNSGGAPAQVISPMQMTEVQMATAFRAAVEDLNLSVSVEEINRVGGQVKVVENLGAM